MSPAEAGEQIPITITTALTQFRGSEYSVTAYKNNRGYPSRQDEEDGLYSSSAASAGGDGDYAFGDSSIDGKRYGAGGGGAVLHSLDVRYGGAGGYAGSAATTPGGGGGGGSRDTTEGSGGAGALGMVMIRCWSIAG